MKTKVTIELNQAQLNHLACLITGKAIKRTATRKEIVDLCQQHIGGLLGVANPIEEPVDPNTVSTPGSVERQRAEAHMTLYNNLAIPDPEDIHIMKAPGDPSYVRGWNQVKRGNRK